MPQLEKALAQAASSPSHSRASVYVVVALGLVATLVATIAVEMGVLAREEREFNRTAAEFVRATDLRLERFVNATLQAGAFLSATDEVSRSQFSLFVGETEFIERYPGIVGVGFAARVSPEHLRRFIERNREDGAPAYTLRPASKRPEYFPIQFLEPESEENLGALGYDMFSDPVRRKAMERARDSGRPVATGLVTLVQNRAGSYDPGFLVYSPVYAGAASTVAARRRLLVGFAYAPIRAADLFGELLAETNSGTRFRLKVYDGAEPEPSQLMFETHRPASAGSGERWVKIERLQLPAERTWTLEFVMSRGSWWERNGLAGLTAGLGFAFTFLLFSIVDGHWRRAETERQGRSRERADRDFIEAILETTRALILVFDPKLQVIYFNRHAEEVTGYSGAEIRGRGPPLPFIPGQETASARKTIELLVEGRGGDWYEGEIVTKSGERRIVLWSSAVTRSLGGDRLFVISVGADVTQARAAEADRAKLLARSQRDLENLRAERELREKFVATLTHDLRNPLGAARLSAESLRRRAPDSVRLARVVSNIDRADRMIQDLLDAVRARAGKAPPLRVKSVDMVALVQETLGDMSAMLGPRFELHAPEALQGWWSPTGIRRLVENLATNAVKYGDPEAPVVVTIAASGERVSLSVHNEGNPIPPAEQALLFKDFVRSPSAEASDRPGWGLGLSVIQEVTASHRGVVRVTSAPGHGTTFTVTLPVDARAEATADEDEEESGDTSRQSASESHPRLD